MNNLFYPELVNIRKYNRDSRGRFADYKDGRIDRLERENAALRQTIKSLLSQIVGVSRIIRLKDEEILKLKRYDAQFF